tara:strand:- start:3519 stop:4454 length:936 start_codon:yes stop_codon:yes gene_type:complete
MTRNAPHPETLLVRDRPGQKRRRVGDLTQCLVNGTVGECVSHRAEGLPVWRTGMLLVVLEYFAFVAVSMFGNTPAPKNVSICGFLVSLVPAFPKSRTTGGGVKFKDILGWISCTRLTLFLKLVQELVPNWVFFLYAHVAAAGVDCTVFAALAIFRKETAESGNKGIGVARGLLMLLCAVCLAGFSAVPRCLWDVHQNLVLCWVVATSAAMFLSLLRERSCEGYSVFPLFLWSCGTFTCITFYYESSMRFYVAEATTVVAYVLWCSNLHRVFNRKTFSVACFLCLDGLIGVTLLLLFRYNQTKVCAVTGQWR